VLASVGTTLWNLPFEGSLHLSNLLGGIQTTRSGRSRFSESSASGKGLSHHFFFEDQRVPREWDRMKAESDEPP
jgi:hypothetical protein